MRGLQKSKRPVFWSILISYLLISIVILLITGIGYYNYYQLMRNNMGKWALQEADTVIMQMEQKFVEVQKALEVFAYNSDLKEMSGLSDHEISVQVPRIISLKQDLYNHSVANLCSDLFVWFDQSQSIFGMNSRRFNTQMMELFYKTYNLNADEFQEIIHSNSLLSIYTLDNGNIWIIRKTYGNNGSQNGALIAQIKSADLLNQIQKIYQDQFLLLTSGDIILYTSDSLSAEAFSEISDVTKDQLNVKIQNTSYYFLRKDIGFINLSCFVGVSQNHLMLGMRPLLYITILICIGAVFLAILLSWKMANRTYQPVKQLMHILSNESDERFHETYDNLMLGLKDLMEENKKLVRHEKSSRDYVYSDRLSYILEEDITDEAIIVPIMLEWAGIAAGDSWSMVLIQISDEADDLFKYQQYTKMNDDTMDLKYFVLKNIMSELIFDQCSGNLFKYHNEYIAIVKTDTPEVKNSLQEDLKDLIVFYMNAMNVRIYVQLGNVTTGFKNIAGIYAGLEEEIKYNLFWFDKEAAPMIWQMDTLEVFNDKNDFDRYLDASRKLMNYLEMHDYKEAYAILDDMFRETISRDRKYLQLNIYRMYGLISTLSMTLNVWTDDKDKAFFESLCYEERLYRAKNANQLLEVSKEMFESIIIYYSGKEKNGIPAWMDAVQDYIRSNYMDINLSVSAIAARFNVSVPHLSRTFKSCLGTGILEYIHMLRVDKAKELLAAGKSVEFTAELTGYLDAQALRRAFKRQEGITPGQYRLVKNSKEQEKNNK